MYTAMSISAEFFVVVLVTASTTMMTSSSNVRQERVGL